MEEGKLRVIFIAGETLPESVDYLVKEFSRLDCWKWRILLYAKKYFNPDLYKGLLKLERKHMLEVVTLIVAQTIDLTVPAYFLIEKMSCMPRPVTAISWYCDELLP